MLHYHGKPISFAQHHEDIILYGYFRNTVKEGFYIDIGANHPVQDSVTKFFSLRGWKGINIEPQRSLKKLLDQDRPRDINLSVALSDKKGTATFRQYPSSGLSTFSQKIQQSYEGSGNNNYKHVTESKLPLLPLSTVLQKHLKVKDIHFMKVDVEGYEYKVLKGNNWSKFRPWVICVESTGSDKRWEEVLEKAGYTRHLSDILNDYYVAGEHRDLISTYSGFVATEVIRYDIVGLLTIKSALRRTLAHAIRKLFPNLRRPISADTTTDT